MTTSTTATSAGAPDATDVPIPDPMPGDAPHAPTIRSLRRLLPFARPAMPALIGSAVTATVAMMCGLAFPLVIQWVIDGPDRAAGPVSAVAAGRPVARARGGRGGPVLGAADAVGKADHGCRGHHAGGDLRPSAEACRRLPRPLARRAADVAGGVRPGNHPPVPGLRAGLPDRQPDHLRGRGGHPADPVLAAGADHRGAGHPADRPVRAVRDQVPGAGPSIAGSGRRSGHHGRGIGARHPDPQGVRPQPVLRPAVPRPGPRSARAPRSARPR